MSKQTERHEMPTAYEPPSHLTVECPKCGQSGAFPFLKTSGSTVEYAGVCDAEADTGGWCGTVLTVQVTTHFFPA